MSTPSVFVGIVAGAVGTVVLDLATYTDMVLRSRPASETPSKLVQKIAEQAGIPSLLGDDDETKNRRSGAGALLGYANGLGVGAAYGVLRPALGWLPTFFAGLAVGAAAMALSDVPMVNAGVTDPSEWSSEDWLADIIPHALYGLAVAITFDALCRADGAAD